MVISKEDTILSENVYETKRANFLNSFHGKTGQKPWKQLDYVLILFLIVTVNDNLKWEINHHFLNLRSFARKYSA